MQIEHYVAHVNLRVEGQLEGNREGLHGETFILAGRLQYVRVVDEARRTNQHKGQLLHDTISGVGLHLKESRFMFFGGRWLSTLGLGSGWLRRLIT